MSRHGTVTPCGIHTIRHVDPRTRIADGQGQGMGGDPPDRTAQCVGECRSCDNGDAKPHQRPPKTLYRTWLVNCLWSCWDVKQGVGTSTSIVTRRRAHTNTANNVYDAKWGLCAVAMTGRLLTVSSLYRRGLSSAISSNRSIAIAMQCEVRHQRAIASR